MTPQQQLATKLASNEIIILDGGTGTEVERRGVPMNNQNWSGTAVLTHPAITREVHEDYIRAGADIVITNTFGSRRANLVNAGLADKVRDANVNAAILAVEARERVAADRPIWVAGGIASTLFFTPDDQRPSVAVMADEFQEQADLLAEGGVDFFVLEMMRDIDLSIAALEAAASTGLPAWVGFSVERDEDGEIILSPRPTTERISLKEAIQPVMAHSSDPSSALVAIMHSDVHVTADALGIVREEWAGALGAYPESGYFEMPNWQFVDIIPPETLLAAAQGWANMGVQAIGGCCGIGPEHIRVLRDNLPRRL